MSKSWIQRAAVSTLAIFAFSIALRPAAARADDFFKISATAQNGAQANAAGPRLLDLTNAVINRNSQFAALNGQNFSANLTYAGVKNALLFSENAGQNQATLTIPATGFTRTFTGNNSSDLNNQIQDFIKGDGADQYAQFLKSINQQSAVASVDGNPQAFTAFVATDAFERFGFNSTLPSAPAEDGQHSQLRLDFGGGFSRAEGFDGNYATASLGTDIRFNDHVALTFGTAFQYRQTAGTNTYFVAEEIGLPITFINRAAKNSGFAWQVTPWGFGGVGISVDQVDGAVLVGGGATSNASYALGDFTFALADQISYASGVPVSLGEYNFDTDVNQWILKNGVKATWRPGQNSFFMDIGIAYSTLFNDAAVPNYWTPQAGFGFNFGKSSGIKFDYQGDFARRYNDNGAKLTFFWTY